MITDEQLDEIRTLKLTNERVRGALVGYLRAFMRERFRVNAPAADIDWALQLFAEQAPKHLEEARDVLERRKR